MKAFFKYTGAVAFILILGATAAYFAWFHNTYEHELQLKPAEIYQHPDEFQGKLITNAHIVDVESGTVLKNRHLLIQDKTILRIFSGSIQDSLKQNFEITDAAGKFIMPALMDMHTHLNSGGLIPPDSSTRLMALEQFARYGVGTIYTLGGQGFGQEITSELINRQTNRALVAPQILATGDIITAPGGYPISLAAQLTGTPENELDLDKQGIIPITPETNLPALLDQKQNLGLHGVKVMVESGLGEIDNLPRLSTEEVQTLVEAANPYNMPVFAHATSRNEVQDAVAAGVDVMVHTPDKNILSAQDPLLQQMVEDSVFYIPTLSLAHMPGLLQTPDFLDDPFLKPYTSDRTLRSLENRPLRFLVGSSMQEPAVQLNTMYSNFNLMREAGIKILMGTDAGNPTIIPGYSAHKELEYMSEAGMTNAEVLRAATISPARFLGLESSIGSITEGKTARLIILDTNPLEDIRNTRSIDRVMLDGFWID